VGIRAGFDPSVASVRVNQYERQRHQPAFEVVRRLADVLKKPTAYFYAVDDSLAELIAAYDQLTASDRANLLAAVRAHSK
jgi:transcriptional regulator with XRE-family HTH domain